jgi:hypothetical protein
MWYVYLTITRTQAAKKGWVFRVNLLSIIIKKNCLTIIVIGIKIKLINKFLTLKWERSHFRVSSY